MLSALGGFLCLAALGGLRGARGDAAPRRSGPWPGLTPRGAALLLDLALLLAGTQLLLGSADPNLAARGALPYLPLATVGAVLAALLAVRVVPVPGVAAAVTGAYLLPRGLVSLAFPAVAPPPLLLVPAVLLDLCCWLRPADLQALAGLWPRRGQAALRWKWRPRKRGRRRVTRSRAALGAAAYAAALACFEPSFELFLGADPARWSLPTSLAGGALAVLGALVLSLVVIPPEGVTEAETISPAAVR